MGFVIVRKSVLEKCEGNAHSLALDLVRPVGLHAKDHAMALHPAHAYRRRAGRGR